MKYFFTFLAFLTQIYLATAQITITADDIADVGTSLPRIVNGNPGETILPGNGGADLSWDFSAFLTEDRDTVRFMEVDSTPYAGEFSNSDVCIRLGSDIDYAYAAYSPNDVKIQGASQYIDELEDNIVVHFTPEQTIMEFPVTYNSSFNDSYGFTVVQYYGETVTLPGIPFPVMVDSIKIINTTDATNNFDAWGELQTPYGVFNTIRNWRVDYMENQLFAKSNTFGYWIDVTSWLGEASTDTVSVYSWWANDVGYPVFEIETDYNTGTIEKASCLEVGNLSAKQFTHSTNHKISAYPIPANNKITIKSTFKGQALVRIFDMTGSLVKIEKYNSSNTSINVSDLSESLYFYTLLGYDKKEIGQGKFYIIR